MYTFCPGIESQPCAVPKRKYGNAVGLATPHGQPCNLCHQFRNLLQQLCRILRKTCILYNECCVAAKVLGIVLHTARDAELDHTERNLLRGFMRLERTPETAYLFLGINSSLRITLGPVLALFL
jgi:hypothetical protein